MTEQEWCAQHPEACDEEGYYLYQDKPWEGTDPCDYDAEYAEMLQHQAEQEDFIHLYTDYLMREFKSLSNDEKDVWIKDHQAEYDVLEAKYDPPMTMPQPKQPVQNMDPDEIPF